MAIDGQDNKWRVSVDGQLDIPFDTKEDAAVFAKEMEGQGFEAFIYFCPKDETK